MVPNALKPRLVTPGAGVDAHEEHHAKALLAETSSASRGWNDLPQPDMVPCGSVLY
jgi:hypothetical protein